MKVVVPYLELEPATYRAACRWPDVDFVPLHDDPVYGYSRLIVDLWAAGETFCIVEHDVVPHRGALGQLAVCRHDYCAFPYPWVTCVGVALGCTKFTGRLLEQYPHAATIAARIPSAYGEPGHFRQFDVWLQAAVLRDLYGLQPHGHLPAVAHLNEAKRLDALFADKPPVLTVEGRTFLEPGLVERIAVEVAAERAGG